jgi:Ca2+-binding EF-hand superfamily protein
MKSLPLLLPLAAVLLLSCQSTPQPKDRFDEADLNGDGKLSHDEVSDYLVNTLFVSRDANKDGQLTLAEWDPQATKETNRQFALRDTNKDGLVSLEEAKVYARKARSFDHIMKAADADGDGFITHAEAIAYYGSKEGPLR